MKKHHNFKVGNTSMYIETSTVIFSKKLNIEGNITPFDRHMNIDEFEDFIIWYSKFVSYDNVKRYIYITEYVTFRNGYRIILGKVICPYYPHIVDIDGFLIDGNIFRKLIMLYKEEVKK